jgi:hypothetical protein
MVATAALLVDEVLPRRPLRQWVLSLPRFLLATEPQALTPVLATFIELSGTWVAGNRPDHGVDRPLLRRLGSWRAHVIPGPARR